MKVDPTDLDSPIPISIPPRSDEIRALRRRIERLTSTFGPPLDPRVREVMNAAHKALRYATFRMSVDPGVE